MCSFWDLRRYAVAVAAVAAAVAAGRGKLKNVRLDNKSWYFENILNIKTIMIFSF